MSTLWTFGDSQTYGHGCRPNSAGDEYYNQYKEDGDDIWPVLLANKLNLNCKNMGIAGASNDTIVDTIIDNFNKIKKGDVVIIGKTFYERFDVPNKVDNILQPIFGEISSNDIRWENWLKSNDRTAEEMVTLVNFIYYYATDPLYEKRQNKRFDFIKSQLKEKGVSVFEWKNDDKNTILFDRIDNHTKGKIQDKHYSFRGHMDFSNYMYALIQNGGKKFIF
jgi:hypothetical protein